MKIVAKNRRARHDYQILETLEAGIMLTGQEVKSCRAGNVHLAGAYVSILNGVPMLKNATIAPYSHASGLEGYEPNRDRALLLQKSQIQKIDAEIAEKGTTLVPLEMKAGRYIKLVIGLAKGQKKYDKRQKIKEKEIARKLKQGREY